MNKALRYVINYNKKYGFGTDPEEIHETLLDGIILYKEKINSFRNLDEYFVVVDIDSKDKKSVKIGFITARYSGNLTSRKKKWRFDVNSVCEVKKSK